jgi:acyl-CoA dehydrogenase
MKVASVSISAGVTVMVPNSLGPAKLLLSYGTEAQKDYYLPRLANGTDIPCFALTGPEAGSDAASMPDQGIVCRQTHGGKADVLGIWLNWDKRYITPDRWRHSSASPSTSTIRITCSATRRTSASHSR